MLRRKTLKNLTRLFTQGLAPLLPRAPRAPRVPRPPRVPRTVRKAAGLLARPPRVARPRAKSPGVAARPRLGAASGGRWITGAGVGPAGMRRYRLFLPAARLHGQSLPLLVMLHGCDQTAEAFAASTRMHQLAARQGFAVLYPEQDRLANVHGCWNWFDTRNGRAFGEAALILQAIDQACLYGLDRKRVAIAGLSAGASMAALVVTRYPQRFQAVAMHSGVPPGTARSGLGALSAMRGHGDTQPLRADATAMAAHWPALLVVHGGADAVVKPGNGEAAVQAWADAAGAHALPPRRVQRGQRHGMDVTEYRAGRRAVATLVLIPSLGHAWSGGAASQAYGDARGPDASRLIWAFVQRQFLRAARLG